MTTNRQPSVSEQHVAGPDQRVIVRLHHRSSGASWQRAQHWLRSRLRSFPFAFAGIGHLLRTQGNAQVHMVLGSVAVALGFLLNIERGEWLALALTITLVLAAEGVNTAVEAVVDLASPDFHPLARVAKDVAAGTVLLTAIGAVAVGLIVFLPRLWAFAGPLLAGAR
ncbi:MAG: diacylglycerol kinase family protein [Chloroflexi bacterium]|nr:diacylglycerol kinase family protein [Chloroflexota bacterium]